jgi:putative DNA primase/helicase
MSAPVKFTLFRDVQARRAKCITQTLDELAHRIEHPKRYPAKTDCPLVKFAIFGRQRTARGSLRHDANVLSVTGVEGDHDAGTMTLEEAAEQLSLAGVEALLYTSPSHRPDGPRWRVLALLSQQHPPSERRRFAARLNGVLRGALSAESFNLSQAFYIGRVNGAPYEWRRVDGQSIDLLDELDSLAIDGGRREGKSRSEKTREAQDNDPVVRRLRELGMVKRDRVDGGVDIRCPFEAHHSTEGGAGDTTYFPPHTGGFAQGHFKCFHSHCAKRTDKGFVDAIGMRAKDTPTDSANSWPQLVSEMQPPHKTTDLANAWRLAKALGEKLLHVSDIGWHTWRGTHWERDEAAALGVAECLSRVIAGEAAECSASAAKTENSERREVRLKVAAALVQFAQRSESRGKIEAALALAVPFLDIKPQELDGDPMLLNCANGTLDLRSGELRPHRRGDFITRCIPLAYDPSAMAPKWFEFLERIFGGKKTLIEFVQRAAGYSLTAQTGEQCIFILHGGGANGKSVLLGALQGLLGSYAKAAAPDLLMVKHAERHPTEVADLRGARLVVAIESGEGRRLHETLVKTMTGGDRLKGRFMREDFFEFEPAFKLWLATNHKPAIRGTDHAIWRRIRLIPFEVTIPERDRDQRLPEKLKAELRGILAWCVQGCYAWQEDGLSPPKEVLTATESYRAEMDVVAKFIEEACVLHPQAEIKSSYLYRAYKAWCENTGERYESQTSFSKRLDERGFKKRHSGGTVWKGIRIAEDFKAKGFE